MKKPCETQSMARLWLHLLLDSALRGWLMLVAALVYLASQVALVPEGKQAAGSHAFLMAAYFIGLYAYQQYAAYPLLAALPLSRTTRGRFAWAQHVLVLLTFNFLFFRARLRVRLGRPPAVGPVDLMYHNFSLDI